MKQFTLKINNRLSGIKESSVDISRGEDIPNGGPGQTGEQSTVADAIRMRQLKGRIKILELELQKSREDSFKVGFEEGRRSAIAEAQKSVDAMRIELQAVELKYLETIEQIEAPLLALARKMARQVLAVELQSREDGDEIFVERLRKMLYELVEQNKIVVEVNPDQAQLVRDLDVQADLNMPETTELNVIANRDLAKGESLLKSNDFFIDGTFDTQLDHLHDQLRDEEE